MGFAGSTSFTLGRTGLNGVSLRVETEFVEEGMEFRGFMFDMLLLLASAGLGTMEEAGLWVVEGFLGSEVEGFGRELVDLFTKLDGFMREVVDFWADDTDLGTDASRFLIADCWGFEAADLLTDEVEVGRGKDAIEWFLLPVGGFLAVFTDVTLRDGL